MCGKCNEEQLTLHTLRFCPNEVREYVDRLTRENADLRAKLAAAEKARDEQAEAVRVLGADIARTQQYVLKLRNGYADLKRSIGKVSCAHPSDALTQLIQSWDDFANNPTAAAAVKEAGQ